MKLRTVLISGFGIGIVFGGAVRTLEAMGVENAVRICLFVAIVATVMMGALSQ